ncbi:hypothetical protein BHM03_00018367 [Ensete ventricosum]|nr:hypothetical protein BHM03_00018367 [Ensete ventricosum]
MEVSLECGERLPTGKSAGASDVEEEDIEELIVGRGCRDSRRRAGWHLLQEEQSTGRYYCRNGQHKMQALVDDSTWQISLPKCHTNGV